MRSVARHQVHPEWRSRGVRTPACRRFRTTASLHAGKHSSNGATAEPSRELLAAEKFGWALVPPPVSILKANRPVRELPVDQIRRPLSRTRKNNEEKVQALMESIAERGLQEPIDVLEVEGKFYGFSGCHRYEAHQRLGKPTIKCRIQKANQQALRMHLILTAVNATADKTGTRASPQLVKGIVSKPLLSIS